MALDNTQLLTLVGVLVVLFAVIVYNNVAAARARGKGKDASPASGGSSATRSSTTGAPVDPLLVKFARHDGSIVGESVALDGDRLILKQAGVFKAVPKAQARVEGDDLVLTGAIDWAKAAADGAAWHAGHRAEAVPEVSGTLTRSEDVKAPAMASTKDR